MGPARATAAAAAFDLDATRRELGRRRPADQAVAVRTGGWAGPSRTPWRRTRWESSCAAGVDGAGVAADRAAGRAASCAEGGRGLHRHGPRRH